MEKNRAAEVKMWGIVACIAAIAFLFSRLIQSTYDFDMFFLVATGRDILRNGIVHIATWTIDSNISVVIQQWLYTVLLAWMDGWGGHFGMMLFVAVQLAILIWIMLQLGVMSGFSVKAAIPLVLAGCLASYTYVFSVRPETVTLILVFFTCYALERLAKTGHVRWLLLLPVTMLFEINLHASMWPFHFCIVLAYLVPGFWLPNTDNTRSKALLAHWKAILLFCLFSIPVLFLNPYGIDGVLYVIRSYLSGTFKFVAIVELQMPPVDSVYGIAVVVAVVMAMVCHCLKSLTNRSLYLLMGFGFLSVITLRNNMFMILPVFFLCQDLCTGLLGKTFELSRKGYIAIQVVCCIWVLICVASVFQSVKTIVQNSDDDFANRLAAICEYLDENSDDGDRIFTGFNTGACLEYYGFADIYIDARPELYMAKLNHERDILPEYSRYCTVGVTWSFDKKTMPLEWRYPVTADEMSDWFDSYAFDYLIVMPQGEAHLAGYLAGRDDYVFVSECSSANLILYRKA